MGPRVKHYYAKPPHVSKTSASYEASSKTHTSSLQVERFARDFLQNSRVNPPKRALRTRLPQTHTSSLQNERFVRDFLQNSRVKSPKRASHTRLPPKVIPSKQLRSHANPKVTATFTSATTRNLTIPCACHENLRVHKCTSTPQKPHKVLCLPQKVTISHHVSFSQVYTFRHESTASKQQPETQSPMSQPHPTPRATTLQTPIPM